MADKKPGPKTTLRRIADWCFWAAIAVIAIATIWILSEPHLNRDDNTPAGQRNGAQQ